MKKSLIKKALLAALTLGLLAALAGCASEAQPETEPPASETRPEQPPETEPQDEPPADEPQNEQPATLLYQGHASLRITTPEGKVIYVDPFAGDGYDLPADLILVTHGHDDHNKISAVETQNPECVIITNTEAVIDGEHQVFELDFAKIEAVQHGNNTYHDILTDAGYIITLTNGVTIYAAGDTAKTEQMAEFAERSLDYAFFGIDEQFVMSPEEAEECAALVGAKYNIPYHTQLGELFVQEVADKFNPDGKLIVLPGEEIELNR